MTRDERKLARENRLNARRQAREIAPKSPPPQRRLVRSLPPPVQTTPKPCGCTRSKG